MRNEYDAWLPLVPMEQEITRDYFTYNMRNVAMSPEEMFRYERNHSPIADAVRERLGIADRGTHYSAQPRDGSTKPCKHHIHGDCVIKYGRIYGPKGNLIAS